MTQIRNCVPEDIPNVAQLYQKIFRDSEKPAHPSLESYLHDLFFKGPDYSPELGSRVYISASGALKGFVGVLPQPMSFRGQLIRGAQVTTLMVDSPKENPWAGVALLKSALTGPQDLSFGDDANDISRYLWEKLGGQSLPLESMEWVRVFRPAGFALSIFGNRFRPLAALRPACFAFDRIAARLTRTVFWLNRPLENRFHNNGNVDTEIDDDAMLYRYLPQFSAPYALRPAWDLDRLKWQLRHASRKQQYGTLFRRLVSDAHNEPLGCYLYYGRRGGVARLLQLLARPEAADFVLHSLLTHAYERGCVGITGAVQSRLIYALRQRGCAFLGRQWVLVHSKNADILKAAAAGDCLLNGFAGEEWARIIGDEFM